MKTEPIKEVWITEDDKIKEYLIVAKEYYKGAVNFVRAGKKCYSAKLDPTKLKIGCPSNIKEAYFDINLTKTKTKKKTTYKDFFYLRLIDLNMDTNSIKLF